jgi:hypothetical protein
MYTTQVREAPQAIDARAATLPDITAEPSHIHIPRPSRRGRTINRRLDDGNSQPGQLTVEAQAAA